MADYCTMLSDYHRFDNPTLGNGPTSFIAVYGYGVGKAIATSILTDTAVVFTVSFQALLSGIVTASSFY